MSDFRSIITLNQITPMIHFQHSDYGACLRASDVKPRLDKFIISKNGGLGDCKTKHREWFIDPDTNDALNYRMTISIGEDPKGLITSLRKKDIEREKNKPGGNMPEMYEKYKRDIVSSIPSYMEALTVRKMIHGEERRVDYVPTSYFGNMVKGENSEEKCNNIIEKYFGFFPDQ